MSVLNAVFVGNHNLSVGDLLFIHKTFGSPASVEMGYVVVATCNGYLR